MSRSFFPVATALKAALKDGYTPQIFKADLGAAVVVSLVALPLSMALAIAVGLPPQHGLYTAIVAGIVTAFLGGSMVQVSGPTAAFVAILAPIVAQYGLMGLIWCQLMAGGLLVLMGVFRLGKYIEHVPYAVTVGFTAGIAVVIATLSLNDFLGLGIPTAELGPHYIDKVSTLSSHLNDIPAREALIGIVTLVVIFGARKLKSIIPAPILGIAVATSLAMYFQSEDIAVRTIETVFDGGLPPYAPSFHWPEAMNIVPLLWPALTIALLAALESLLSATVADNVTGQKHDPDAELTGIGFGNLAAGLFAGIPATGALARTAANIQGGAKTPFASAMHAVFLLIFMVAFAPYISKIPMAALSALLLVTAWRMAHLNIVVDIVRAGSHKDTVVLFVSLILTVLVDMVVGVGAGLALSYFFHLQKRFKR